MPYAEVIGDPVDHSKSPLIHEYWLSQLKLAGDYRKSRVASDELGRYFLERRSDPDWRGCNVTIPHKQTVLACLDDVEKDARMIGAVNIVIPRDGGLTGYNSDVNGVATALQGVDIQGSAVVMVGAGGAARAAAAYLGSCGVRRLTILVRDPAKAQGLQALVPETDLEILPLTGARSLDAEPAAVINASPLGMLRMSSHARRVARCAHSTRAHRFVLRYGLRSSRDGLYRSRPTRRRDNRRWVDDAHRSGRQRLRPLLPGSTARALLRVARPFGPMKAPNYRFGIHLMVLSIDIGLPIGFLGSR